MIIEKQLLKFNKIGIVCNDIGGAYFVKAFLEEFELNNFVSFCEGPAKSLFKKNYNGSLEDFIKENDLIITGTSWSSDIEKCAIKISKDTNKTCYTVLDHWVNFKERFILNNKIIFPDVIIVFDAKAFQLAETLIYPTTTKIIKTKTNLFIKNFLKGSLKIEKKFNNRILFIDEPIKEHYEIKLKKDFTYLGYNEFSAFTDFLKQKNQTKFRNFIIDIKLHPSSDINKYSDYLNDKILVLDPLCRLEDILSGYKFVVGLTSMALFLAKNMDPNNIVYSIIPKSLCTNHIFDLNSFYDI